MIRGRMIHTQEDWMSALSIRSAVLQKECKIPLQEDFDGSDADAVSVLVFDSETPVATARMISQNGAILIDRVAVLPEFRRKEYGSFAVRILAEQAFSSGAAEVYAVTGGQDAFFASMKFTPAGNGRMKLVRQAFCCGCDHPCD